MSLVIEAMGAATSEWREYSTEELVRSRTSAALERSAGSLAEGRLYLRWVRCVVLLATAVCASEAASDMHTAVATPMNPILFIDLRLAPPS